MSSPFPKTSRITSGWASFETSWDSNRLSRVKRRTLERVHSLPRSQRRLNRYSTNAQPLGMKLGGVSGSLPYLHAILRK